MIEVDKLGKALGIWNLKVDDFEVDIKPSIVDIREYKNILFNNKYKKDKPGMFAALDDFFINMIKKDHPYEETPAITEQDYYQRITDQVVLNSQEIFKQSQLVFKFTTQEKLDEQEKMVTEQLKKKIGNV